MRQKSEMVFLLVGLMVVGILAAPAALAQNAAPPSLKEQLEAQYNLAKIAYNGGQVTVTEPGTVLVIQKAGILGVPPGNLTLAPATYKDGSLNPPGKVATAMAGKDARQLPTGEKVYVTKIDVDPKKDKVTFRIMQCDACNGTAQPSSYKADVFFEFPKGSLATASVPDVEDAIANVFALDTGTAEAQPAQPEAQREQPAPAQAAPAQGVTNDDIIKMVQAKLADTLIVTKIKSSACNFDTSTDTLIKLKQMGVSDAVLQAMEDAGAAAPPAGPGPAAPPAVESAPSKPYAVVVEGDTKHPLPASKAEIARTKSTWSGDSLQSAATDAAIDSAAMSAAPAAIGAMTAAGAGLAAVPLVGVGLSSVINWRQSKVKETFIWALPHATSKNVLAPGSKIEFFYDDIPGVDADEYQPALVKLEPTKSNMRLVCAQKVEMRGATMKAKENVVLESQAAKISKISTGDVVLEFEQPLPAGEYGVLLRSPKRQVDPVTAAGSGIAANEAALVYTVWDFTVQTAEKH